MAAVAARPRSPFLPVIGGLILVAWTTLLVWEQSPYGRFLDHGNWTEIGLAGSICRFLPAGDVLLPAALHVGGWVLMIVAMMLPTILPLLALFQRLTADRPDRLALRALLIAGYLAAWGAFGILVHVVDIGLHAVVATIPWLAFNGWAIGVGVLAIAGAFQFSTLKYRCLDRCRTPFSFVNRHWRGRAAGRAAFLLGADHGLFCVGCCWAIMLVMFVVGTGSVGWMLAIGAVMAIEKNVSWGRHLSAPLGVALLAAAAAIVAVES